MKIKVLSYNIHKGFDTTNLRSTLNDIKKSVHSVRADILCLQEVSGLDKNNSSQLEYIADTIWKSHAYGKNAVSSRGHHGNAILSQFPILNWTNTNISAHKLDNRGLLHSQINIPEIDKAIHILCTHFGLLHHWRESQLRLLINHVHQHIPEKDPLIICGDFNDWNTTVTTSLRKNLKTDEVFYNLSGQHARTFPSWLPMMPLDRIYYRNIELSSAQVLYGKLWRKLSDHLPLSVEFSLT